MLDTDAAPVAETPEPTPSTPAPAPVAKEESRAERVEREGAELDDDLRKAYRNAQKGRDESGKYTPKDGETRKVAAPDEKPAPVLDKAKDAPKPDAKDAKATDAKAPEAKPATPAPKSWKPEVAAKWANVPPEVQSYIAEREASIQKVSSEHGQAKAALDAINKAYEPHASRLNGADRTEHLKNLLYADAMLDRDPLEFIKFAAKSKGIDLNALVPDPYAAGDPQSAQWEAKYSAAQARIDALEQKLSAYDRDVTSRKEAEQTARDQATQKLIAEFSADKPDFDDLSAEIGAIVSTLRTTDPTASEADILKRAYESAQWANPKSRQALIEKQTRDAEAKRIEEAKAQAERAKRAGSINVRGSAAPVPGQSSIDDDLRAIWRKRQSA